MALRIEKAFAVKMETLLELQTWHDAHSMRQRAEKSTSSPINRPVPPSPNKGNPVDLLKKQSRCPGAGS